MYISKTLPVFLTVTALSVSSLWAESKPIVLIAPPDYQVIAMSPNGKWATGVFGDYANVQRAFLWNLESGNIDLLSTTEESQGWSVSDNGVVGGSFTDHSLSDIGAGTMMPGYYKDGQWHSVECPPGFTGPADNYHGAGVGYAISGDGTVLVGSLYLNGNFSPAVWRNGELVQLLDVSNPGGMQGGAPYCVSPDGKTVGGWSYRDNRACTLWNLADGKRTFISDSETPWSSVNRFSPDGKKVLYGGGWDMSVDVEADTQYYFSIYDVETGQATSLPAYDRGSTVQLFGISNSYTVVGSTGDYDGGRAIIYPNGQGAGILMVDYLRERGVDFSDLGLLVSEEMGYVLLFRAQDISADDNVFCLLGYDAQGMRSIVVMLNQDADHAAPIDIKTRQLSGINTAELRWSAPVRSQEGISGYRIYRDGEQIAQLPADARYYYDVQLGYGSYIYAVSTIYDDGTEMQANAPALTIAPQIVARPEGFTTRQKGAYSILAEWNAPGTNLINKTWYTPATANLRGFGILIDGQTIEVGIGFGQEELANYEGYKISKVNFYPMSEQLGWTLNVYRYVGEEPVRIYSQPITQELVYKQRNTVILDEPLPVPTDGDVIVAIEVMVPYANGSVIGMDYGRNTPGYSDLLRLSTEPDFYSYYYATASNGYPDYATFMIDAILTAEGQDLSADQVIGYRLAVDGQEVATTTDLSWKSDKVASGAHTLSLQALFADGKASDPITSDVNVTYNYKYIEDVDISVSGSTVTASWSTPVDDDARDITYATGQPQINGIIGPSENNYGIMAGVEYGEQMLRGYDGYQITSLSFYPTADATFTFFLREDGEMIAEVPVDDYDLYRWNTVVLDEPILINEKNTYFVVLDCYDVDPEMPPLAIDNRLPLAFTSDLISLDDYYWSSISVESGLSGNWMIGITIADPQGQPMPVDGYDVRIDNSRVAEKIAANTFSYDLQDKAAGQHSIRVNTYYTGRAAAVNGLLVTFTIDASGISQTLAEAYRLTRGTDVLCIEGADVSGISILSADGKVVARAAGNKVGISSLPAGIYMVKANAGKQLLTYKVVID